VDKVRSEDGTPIAFERVGQGPPLIFVVGAFNGRTKAAPLAEALKDRFAVFTYDRRGRGDSGDDTRPYAVKREIEDLGALLEEAGGEASVFGYSSGAILSLRAAARGLPIGRLALYEPPLTAEGVLVPDAEDLARRIGALVEEGKRGDAVALYQTEALGLPAEVVSGLRQDPFWPALEAMAHTTVYETEIVGDGSVPTDEAASVGCPALVLAGGESFPFMIGGAKALAGAMPDASARVLEGQSHDLNPSVLAPVLEEFFAGAR
jgi:pimeloyl-ACP methyl ester carboxylesterase